MKKTKLQWHPAFGAAMRITLQDEMKYLEMHEEYLLNKKPLQMDVLIIKNLKDIPIRKAIGKIFRKHNIIEYKSPGDNLSINDFYKVYGYACIYQSDTNKVKEIDPEELTLTFVCSHYPESMLRHLKRSRGISAEYQGAGIYYLKGDPIPIQLLIAPKLSDSRSLNQREYPLSHSPEALHQADICRQTPARPHSFRELCPLFSRTGNGTYHQKSHP